MDRQVTHARCTRRADRSGQDLADPPGRLDPGQLLVEPLVPVGEPLVVDPEQVQEFVTHSWYSYPDETKGLHPWDGVTVPMLETVRRRLRAVIKLLPKVDAKGAAVNVPAAPPSPSTSTNSS